MAEESHSLAGVYSRLSEGAKKGDIIAYKLTVIQEGRLLFAHI